MTSKFKCSEARRIPTTYETDWNFRSTIIGLLLDLSSAFDLKAQSMSTYNELTEWNYVILNLQLLNGVFNAFLKIASDGDCLIKL